MAQVGGGHEEILMTPLKVKVGHLVKVERVPRDQLNASTVKHFATGPYQGIVINQAANEETSMTNQDTAKWFTAHVADLKSADQHSLMKERRELRFWIHPEYKRKANSITERFFQGIIESFPKDPIHFLIKVLSLVKEYPEVLKLELEMRPLRAGESEHGTQLAGMAPYTPDTDRKKKKKKKKKPGKQDDVRYEEGGSLGGSYGDLVEGEIGHAQRGADGALLDASGRRVPFQEDMIASSNVGSLGSQGSYQQSQIGHVQRGADGALLDASGRRVPYQEDMIPSSAVGSLGGQGSFQQSQISTRVTTTKTVVMQQGTGASQDDFNRQQGVEGVFTYQQNYSGTATSARVGESGTLKKKPVLTWKGWEVIWATKKHKILSTLEDAYPNILGVDDIVRQTDMKRADVEFLLGTISQHGLIQQIAKGRWMRTQAEAKPVMRRSSRDSKMITQIEPRRKHEFKMVSHIPRLPVHEQPTVAVVTLLYCEKIAVDAMMEPKTTFIRAKTEGESQVYTVGNIGKHRVVCTKLPRVGRETGAVIASGNTITRLLGTFSMIEHVILVGVGGGVPCYNDDRNHVRCGDVVISVPENTGGSLYLNVKKYADGKFSVQAWGPSDNTLLCWADNLRSEQASANSARALSWESYLAEAVEDMAETETGTKFDRPAPDNDRLYRTVGGQVVEMPHPAPFPGSLRREGMPFLHFSPIATGKPIGKDEELRMQFAQKHGVKVVDVGFQTVMESIQGNRKESFAVIRGISDYVDGGRRQEWQPYASVAAAAVLKALIMQLPTKEEDDD